MTLAARRPGLDLAVQRAKIHATTGTTKALWPVQLAADLRELGATWHESAEVCADAAWAARAAGRSVLNVLEPEHVTDHGDDTVTGRTYRHLYLSTLRYDFRCRTIESLVGRVPLSVLLPDYYTRALYAFAFLGQSKYKGLDLMQEVLDKAGDHPKTLHVLLHGLWLGNRLPNRETLMLQILERPPFAPRTDPIALFREAGALRSLGRYRAALESIDRALEMLPHGDLSVHADLVRERSLIAAADDAQRLTVRGTEGRPE